MTVCILMVPISLHLKYGMFQIGKIKSFSCRKVNLSTNPNVRS